MNTNAPGGCKAVCREAGHIQMGACMYSAVCKGNRSEPGGRPKGEG
jgi:hypothetical protein